MLAQSGDRTAAEMLYSWFGIRIFRGVILVRLPDVDQAEDVLWDTFRIVFEKIEQFQIFDRSIFFWIRRIAINLVIDSYRKRVKNSRIAESILAKDALSQVMSIPEKAPDQGLYDQEARMLIERSLEKINERYAKALRLRLLEDRTREECAQMMEVSVGNFDVIFHRACAAFRDNYPP
jgi:RNA polymerase sigma-70 factor (ECF subfamily)